ncbi:MULTISPECIES: arsenic resistance protein [Hyphomicrobiales]|jgi:ACR3 family arsenite efflux pump ArsB|uniref:arsenic resistance protein n=1 Tax=Methylobacterium sp. CCH7-A2 TaxID=1768789 RepID=UPI00082BB8D6|nr:MULTISPECIES: arsenic resistance protein [Hyphomicrobiales]
MRDLLETHQVAIYFAVICAASALTFAIPGTAGLDILITPALALMLFVTFLQVPLQELGKVFARVPFMVSLLTTNFVAIPVLAAFLLPLLPGDPMVRLGVLMVLLTPCIDYVVTFAHLGRADARLLLASTPILLIVQMLLLPVYLGLLLGNEAMELVHIEPFLHAFVWLIVVPLWAAAAVQVFAAKSEVGRKLSTALGFLPVPSTALVLFIVFAAVVPQLGQALNGALRAVPIYIAFAILAPLIGWFISVLLLVDAKGARAIAFSAGTRNSLVVLPLALSVPNAMPLLPAIIVAQTLVELLSQLVYIRWIPKLDKP